MTDNRKCCGTCKYNKPVMRENAHYGRWEYRQEMECHNENSEGYGCSTGYDECCEEWEEK